MGEVGAALEAGVNIISAGAKAAEGTTSVGEAVTKTAGGIGTAVESAETTVGPLLSAADAGGSVSEVARSVPAATPETVGGGIGVGAESLPSPVGRVEDTLAPAIGPELDLNNLSPGERAAEAAVEFGQANRVYTDGLRSGNINPDDAKRVSELRQELDKLTLDRLRQPRRGKGNENKENENEEWEVVRKGDKVVIRRRKPGFKRAVGDAVSNLAADVVNDVGKKS